MIKDIYKKIKSAANCGPANENELGFSIFDSIYFAPAEHWDEATGDNFFMNKSYLSVLEDTRPENMHFRYVLIYDSFKKPIAAAYFQIFDFSGVSLASVIPHFKNDKDPKCSVKEFLKKNSGKLSMRLLVCGNVFVSGEYGFVYKPEFDSALAFKALAKAMYRIRKSDKTAGTVSATLVKDFYTEKLNGPSTLKELKYNSFSVEPDMLIEIDKSWKTFDDYLAALSTKYRTRAKSIRKKAQDIKQKDLSADQINKNKERIEKLYQAVHLKAKFRLATLTMDYFVEMKQKLGDAFLFTGYFLDGEMVAFKTFFITNKSLEAHFIGIDYSLNKQYDLYQNLLYDYVKRGIDNKVAKVHLGRTASEIKSNIGAKAHELTCYIKHRNPVSNAIIKPFIESLQTEEWTPRNPFKSAEVKEVEVV